ncbi:peptidoglycan-binding protein [Planctomycetota bacterium]
MTTIDGSRFDGLGGIVGPDDDDVTDSAAESTAPEHDYARSLEERPSIISSGRFAASAMEARLRGALPAAGTAPEPELDGVREGSLALKPGARGAEVSALQRALNAAGAEPPIEPDGQLGPGTQTAIRRFQRQQGLPPDGVVGSGTMAALDRARGIVIPTPPAVAPGALGGKALADRSGTQEEQFKHYERLVQANGGTIADRAGQRTVVGLRGLSPDGEIHGEATRDIREYTDTFVVMWKDRDGRAHVEHFEGSTTTGQKRTQFGGTPDVNRDGKKDIAHLEPGTYFYRRTRYKGESAYGGAGRVPVSRDTSHDGHISEAERRASERRGDTGGAILFHRGDRSAPRSVGCQTLSPAEFNSFERALGRDRNFSYTLIDPRRA